MARAISFVFLVLVGALLIATTTLQGVRGVKSGNCPNLPNAWGAVCVQACSDDESCDGTKKCCTNGCGGRLCMEPVNAEKDWECPAIEAGMGGICVSYCSADNECPGNQKCCSNGCGHLCKSPP